MNQNENTRRIQRAVVSILAITTSLKLEEANDNDDDGDGDKEHIARDICTESAKNCAVVILQCLLYIRQQTLIQRFSADEEAKKQRDREMDHLIIERVRMTMDNLEKYGFSMSNLLEHGMKPDVLEDIKKYIDTKWRTLWASYQS